MKYKLFVILLLFIFGTVGCINQTMPSVESINERKTLNKSKYNEYECINLETELISLETKQAQYTFSFDVKNVSGEDVHYGLCWYLEILNNGNWYTIDFLRDENGQIIGEWVDIALILPKEVEKKIEIW